MIEVLVLDGGEGVALDFDAEGHLAGIEILDAVRRFGKHDTLRQVTLENVGLGEIA